MRYFEVTVYHMSTTIEEVFTPLKKYHHAATIDGETVQYCIQKATKSPMKNWFERGVTELQYHARNLSKTGFVAWKKMQKNPYTESKKEREIKAKMQKMF